jgi:hypothetical protein
MGWQAALRAVNCIGMSGSKKGEKMLCAGSIVHAHALLQCMVCRHLSAGKDPPMHQQQRAAGVHCQASSTGWPTLRLHQHQRAQAALLTVLLAEATGLLQTGQPSHSSRGRCMWHSSSKYKSSSSGSIPSGA